MPHLAIEQVLQRVNNSKADSDFTYFFALLLAAEALAKTVTLGMVAALGDDKNRNRYRLEHALVRSDGLGDWGRALEDALTGPASQYLLNDARKEQTELTKICPPGDWQYEAVRALKAALDELGIDAEDVPARTDLKRWFRLFASLRNKTRAHGATQSSKAGKAASYIQESINIFYNHAFLFQRPWALLHRNISGKYRVSGITDTISVFDRFKRESNYSLRNGVYIHFGAPRYVPLMRAEPELQDFFFPNGGFGDKRYELLSYATDNRSDGDSKEYCVPPGLLPASETEGHGQLGARGECFSNAPDLIREYIARPQLEHDLMQLLLDDRRPIVTLVGKGGIGKTSLAIRTIQELYKQKRYTAVVWLSARDVDLHASGPKPVRPLVVSQEEIGQLYANLVLAPENVPKKASEARSFFEKQLEKNDLGACLYVLDNFETTQNPVEMFNWIDCFIRLPNKILITTRLRDFKGDYPLEVRGMEDDEAATLIENTSESLRIGSLLDHAYKVELIQQSEGHPYVIKIMLGEVARAGRKVNPDRIIAGSDELLTALFERTYASLSPCAQRAFMTLSAWNSSVPRIALEAVLMRSIPERQEVEKGVETLIQYSVAEVHSAPTDQQAFIRLPLVASVFGKRKLNVSPLKTSILSDVEMLQMLGPSRLGDVHLGLAHRLEKFIANIARRVDGGQNFADYAPILEMICRSYNPGWLLLAQWLMESDSLTDQENAKEALSRYLEQASGPDAAEAWRLKARVCYLTNDSLGEIHAFIERAQIETVPFSDVSNTANRLNGLLRDQVLELDRDEKRALASRLLAVLEKRQDEAAASDLSRMAWLALNLAQQDKARGFIRAGLKLEPGNHYCVRMAERLDMGSELGANLH